MSDKEMAGNHGARSVDVTQLMPQLYLLSVPTLPQTSAPVSTQSTWNWHTPQPLANLQSGTQAPSVRSEYQSSMVNNLTTAEPQAPLFSFPLRFFQFDPTYLMIAPENQSISKPLLNVGYQHGSKTPVAVKTLGHLPVPPQQKLHYRPQASVNTYSSLEQVEESLQTIREDGQGGLTYPASTHASTTRTLNQRQRVWDSLGWREQEKHIGDHTHYLSSHSQCKGSQYPSKKNVMIQESYPQTSMLHAQQFPMAENILMNLDKPTEFCHQTSVLHTQQPSNADNIITTECMTLEGFHQPSVYHSSDSVKEEWLTSHTGRGYMFHTQRCTCAQCCYEQCHVGSCGISTSKTVKMTDSHFPQYKGLLYSSGDEASQPRTSVPDQYKSNSSYVRCHTTEASHNTLISAAAAVEPKTVYLVSNLDGLNYSGNLPYPVQMFQSRKSGSALFDENNHVEPSYSVDQQANKSRLEETPVLHLKLGSGNLMRSEVSPNASTLVSGLPVRASHTVTERVSPDTTSFIFHDGEQEKWEDKKWESNTESVLTIQNQAMPRRLETPLEEMFLFNGSETQDLSTIEEDKELNLTAKNVSDREEICCSTPKAGKLYSGMNTKNMSPVTAEEVRIALSQDVTRPVLTLKKKRTLSELFYEDESSTEFNGFTESEVENHGIQERNLDYTNLSISDLRSSIIDDQGEEHTQNISPEKCVKMRKQKIFKGHKRLIVHLGKKVKVPRKSPRKKGRGKPPKNASQTTALLIAENEDDYATKFNLVSDFPCDVSYSAPRYNLRCKARHHAIADLPLLPCMTRNCVSPEIVVPGSHIWVPSSEDERTKSMKEINCATAGNATNKIKIKAGSIDIVASSEKEVSSKRVGKCSPPKGKPERKCLEGGKWADINTSRGRNGSYLRSESADICVPRGRTPNKMTLRSKSEDICTTVARALEETRSKCAKVCNPGGRTQTKMTLRSKSADIYTPRCKNPIKTNCRSKSALRRKSEVTYCLKRTSFKSKVVHLPTLRHSAKKKTNSSSKSANTSTPKNGLSNKATQSSTSTSIGTSLGRSAKGATTTRIKCYDIITPRGTSASNAIPRSKTKISNTPKVTPKSTPCSKHTPASKTTAKHTLASKTATKRTPASKTAAKRTPASKTAAKHTPASKTAAKHTPASRAAAKSGRRAGKTTPKAKSIINTKLKDTGSGKAAPKATPMSKTEPKNIPIKNKSASKASMKRTMIRNSSFKCSAAFTSKSKVNMVNKRKIASRSHVDDNNNEAVYNGGVDGFVVQQDGSQLCHVTPLNTEKSCNTVVRSPCKKKIVYLPDAFSVNPKVCRKLFTDCQKSATAMPQNDEHAPMYTNPCLAEHSYETKMQDCDYALQCKMSEGECSYESDHADDWLVVYEATPEKCENDSSILHYLPDKEQEGTNTNPSADDHEKATTCSSKVLQNDIEAKSAQRVAKQHLNSNTNETENTITAGPKPTEQDIGSNVEEFAREAKMIEASLLDDSTDFIVALDKLRKTQPSYKTHASKVETKRNGGSYYSLRHFPWRAAYKKQMTCDKSTIDNSDKEETRCQKRKLGEGKSVSHRCLSKRVCRINLTPVDNARKNTRNMDIKNVKKQKKTGTITSECKRSGSEVGKALLKRCQKMAKCVTENQKMKPMKKNQATMQKLEKPGKKAPRNKVCVKHQINPVAGKCAVRQQGNIPPHRKHTQSGNPSASNLEEKDLHKRKFHPQKHLCLLCEQGFMSRCQLEKHLSCGKHKRLERASELMLRLYMVSQQQVQGHSAHQGQGQLNASIASFLNQITKRSHTSGLNTTESLPTVQGLVATTTDTAGVKKLFSKSSAPPIVTRCVPGGWYHDTRFSSNNRIEGTIISIPDQVVDSSFTFEKNPCKEEVAKNSGRQCDIKEQDSLCNSVVLPKANTNKAEDHSRGRSTDGSFSLSQEKNEGMIQESSSWTSPDFSFEVSQMHTNLSLNLGDGSHQALNNVMTHDSSLVRDLKITTSQGICQEIPERMSQKCNGCISQDLSYGSNLGPPGCMNNDTLSQKPHDERNQEPYEGMSKEPQDEISQELRKRMNEDLHERMNQKPCDWFGHEYNDGISQGFHNGMSRGVHDGMRQELKTKMIQGHIRTLSEELNEGMVQDISNNSLNLKDLSSSQLLSQLADIVEARGPFGHSLLFSDDNSNNNMNNSFDLNNFFDNYILPQESRERQTYIPMDKSQKKDATKDYWTQNRVVPGGHLDFLLNDTSTSNPDHDSRRNGAEGTSMAFRSEDNLSELRSIWTETQSVLL